MLREVPVAVWITLGALAVSGVVAALIAMGIAWLLGYSD
jgi:hypothetical protein